MENIKIRGGKPLKGTIKVSGGKNAVLPVIAGAVLTDERVTLENVPHITDVYNSCEIINKLGGNADLKNNILVIDPQNTENTRIPPEYSVKMRSSVLFAGALLGKYKNVFLPRSGGCKLGKRPVDMHIEAFKKMGADTKKKKDGILITAKKLKGTEIELKRKSVGATENIMLAAVLAKGRTVIKNAALEPEIVGLGEFLNSMGADISGMGTDVIIINGVKKLSGTSYSIIPDRIEAGTFLCAIAATRGCAAVENVQIECLRAVTDILVKCGCIITYKANGILLNAADSLIGDVHIKTAPYPDFPTDLQAQIMAVLCCAKGESTIEESIFSSRNGHIEQLKKMGADIKMMTPKKFFIGGNSELKGCNVEASDLRAGAALIIGGLCAEGETVISNTEYIFRGYENITEKLKAAGADIERVRYN